MLSLKILIKCIFILCVLFLSSELWGATCTVSTTSANFGNYDTLLATPTDTTGTVRISCSFGWFEYQAIVVVAIGPSSNGNFNPRTMTHGADLLNYDLYIAQWTPVWGNGTSFGSTRSVTLTNPSWFFPGSSSTNLTAYGRIPAGQDVSVGAYTDTLTVTATY